MDELKKLSSIKRSIKMTKFGDKVAVICLSIIIIIVNLNFGLNLNLLLRLQLSPMKKSRKLKLFIDLNFVISN